VLVALDESPLPREFWRVLRVAGSDDLARSQHIEAMRPERFLLCQRIVREGDWPWELIDVETLLDGCATILHYLGPRQIDAASLRARFRMTYDLDVVLEPVGDGLDGDSADATGESVSGSGCANCGCSSGGCGAESARTEGEGSVTSAHGAHGCTTAPHSACASCGIGQLAANRTRRGPEIGA
jgi:hypothetical protein